MIYGNYSGQLPPWTMTAEQLTPHVYSILITKFKFLITNLLTNLLKNYKISNVFLPNDFILTCNKEFTLIYLYNLYKYNFWLIIRI